MYIFKRNRKYIYTNKKIEIFSNLSKNKCLTYGLRLFKGKQIPTNRNGTHFTVHLNPTTFVSWCYFFTFK